MSTSMDSWLALFLGSPGEHVYRLALLPGSPGEHQCGVYNPRASLVPGLHWLAPVQSTIPGLALFPGSSDKHHYRVQSLG